MKKKIFIAIALLLTCYFQLSTAFGQSPNGMSYQAVIRNSSNQLVTNTQIGMEINIRQGSETGTVVYTETQTPTTNDNGLVSIEIGGGAGFNSMNWAGDYYYIETKTAVVAPLTAYTITGVSQLLSVPYAFHAQTSEHLNSPVVRTFKVVDTASNKALYLRQDGNNSYITNKANFLGEGTSSNGTLFINGEQGISFRYGSNLSAGDEVFSMNATAINMNNHSVKNLAEPIDPKDAATAVRRQGILCVA